MDTPHQESLQRAILIGFLSAVTVFVLFELVEFFYSRMAARQAPDGIKQTTEYLAMHDATTGFLEALRNRIEGR